ncbi:MAG: YcnI family copper-binding membrane protein [Jatrophihabitans sp.]|uniref:YcnI family copper-binding membrane protein n=1 Tax=Jatrophihabitans sp. TaxID=1932789 RepID=UPI003F7D62D8
MRLRPVALTGLAVLSATLVLAPAAEAHVTVTAPGVAVGASDAELTFRVPTESASASTTRFELDLPTDHPIAGVLVQPVPGWTATVQQQKLAKPITTDDGDITEVVSQVVWTAQPGQGIKPDFFGAFTIIAGKLPDGVDSLTFKAIQHYSDGKTVKWIETAAPGSTAEPDFPAPVLQLAADSTAKPAASSDASSDSTGVIGIVLGAIGVVLGGAALIFARRRPS